MGIFKKSSKNENKKSSLENATPESGSSSNANNDVNFQPDDIFLGIEKQEEVETKQETEPGELTEKQIQKQNEIETVKSKISKILKSSNIEIVDENFGDEYDLEETDAQKQSQQDYDTLKALFGDKDRNKKDELTLTIDDFDYTYVGKYIEEYDLMHLKNIKHIKLRNPNAKKIKKALIAASVAITIVIGAVCGFMFTKQKPIVLESVKLSQTESNANFYVDDYFNFDGLKLNLNYSNGTNIEKQLTYDNLLTKSSVGSMEFVDSNKSIKFLGGDVILKFQYEGYILDYHVYVKEKIMSGISAKVADGVYSLKSGNYINAKDMLIVLFEYEGYGISKEGDLSRVKIRIDSSYCSDYSKEMNGWKLNKDVSKDSTIEVIYDLSNSEDFSFRI